VRGVEGVEQHVRGFEVAVQDAAFVGVLNRLGDCLDAGGRVSGRHGIVPHRLCQVAAFDVVHREVLLALVFADFMDGDDIWMPQTGRGFGFRTEPLHRFIAGKMSGQDHLHDHGAVQTHLPRLIDYAHPAAGDFL